MPQTITRPSQAPSLSYKEFEGRVLARKEIPAEEDYVREALVAVTGNTDDGGDVIMPGAFQFKRTPKVVWSHDLRTLVGKVLEYEELLPGSTKLLDLAPDLAAKGLGALWFRIQFDPLDPESFKAFRKVDFHEDLGWSIGYETPPDGFKSLPDGRRALTKIYVWEGSPTTFGMNMEARTVALKSLIASSVEDLDLPEEKAKAVADLIATLAAPDPEREEKAWPPLEGSMEETQERLRQALNAWAAQIYGPRDEENDWWVSIDGTFEDDVVVTVRVWSGEREESSFRIPYVEGADGSIELGEAEEVEVRTTVTVETPATEEGATDALAAAAALLDVAGLEEVDGKALADVLEETKKGRVLSEANATALRQAAEAIQKVLAAAEKNATDEDDPKPAKKGDDKKVLNRRIVGKGEGGEIEVPAFEVPEGKELLTDADVLEMMAATDLEV